LGSRAASKGFKGSKGIGDRGAVYICYNPGGLNIYYTRRISICQVLFHLFAGLHLYVHIYAINAHFYAHML